MNNPQSIFISNYDLRVRDYVNSSLSFNVVEKYLHKGGISLFASTIALASMTNFSTLTNIILLGSICTLYSSIGGY
ncbi:hypothetical protein Anas_13407 [Armadillidium nasatum]|uniref:Uncharacterized protein n=1 Tax=Armadillidium nasatum TaxID=96803 RepID=A0A5N5TF19_9CRUS|nr:hypothetical protein Anas_13407 [Armadillidium nasatum]